VDAHDSRDIVDLLVAALARDRVLTEPDALDLRSWDALSQSRIHPGEPIEVAPPICVCLPLTTGEVQAIVALADARRVPVVPFGGGSGLMGGASSLRPGIVVDLRRMDRILEVDVGAATARVQAGVVLEPLQRVLETHGLILGHDPWTLPVATVGGTVSTNSLGYRGGKYGAMGNQVLGLEAVLPQGQICRTRAVAKTSTGLNLSQLFIGGEGCFGILTEVTLRVFSKPARRSLLGFRFPSFSAGFKAVQELFAAGLLPILMDYGDSTDDPQGSATLYLGFEGREELVEAEVSVAVAICQQREGEKLAAAEAQHFWNERHSAARRFMTNRKERREAVHEGLHQDWIHVSLPASKVLAFRDRALQIIAERQVEFRDSGLWTRPELFSVRIAKNGDEKARTEVEETIFALLEAVHRFEGSMEYCHGVGAKLAPLMRSEHGRNLDLMQSLKEWIDPNLIMNPSKLSLS